MFGTVWKFGMISQKSPMILSLEERKLVWTRKPLLIWQVTCGKSCHRLFSTRSPQLVMHLSLNLSVKPFQPGPWMAFGEGISSWFTEYQWFSIWLHIITISQLVSVSVSEKTFTFAMDSVFRLVSNFTIHFFRGTHRCAHCGLTNSPVHFVNEVVLLLVHLNFKIWTSDAS